MEAWAQQTYKLFSLKMDLNLRKSSGASRYKGLSKAKVDWRHENQIDIRRNLKTAEGLSPKFVKLESELLEKDIAYKASLDSGAPQLLNARTRLGKSTDATSFPKRSMNFYGGVLQKKEQHLSNPGIPDQIDNNSAINNSFGSAEFGVDSRNSIGLRGGPSLRRNI